LETEKLISAISRSDVLATGEPVELIETHISYVLLSGEFVYKIKKPVDLGFVDFSSLEKRKYYCLEELRLNKRLASDLYLGLVQITGTSDSPELEGHGQVIEYAVKMKRFPKEMEIRNLLDRVSIPLSCFKQLAIDLVRFHENASTADCESRFANAEALRDSAMANFSDMEKLVDSPEISSRLDRLKAWTHRSLETNSICFMDRKNELRIKECHGDLHLGNLVMIDERIVPFDCLEFNEGFRWIDVASEIAFLVMDLKAYGYDAHARCVLNHYLENSGDYRMIPLLRHYLVYRAMVLAKVACFRARQASQDILSVSSFLSYLDLAEKISHKNNAPKLVITHGLSGCGKTWISDKILEKLDFIRIRSDVLRKHLHGISIDSRSGSGLDSGIYSESSTEAVYKALATVAKVTLEAGYSVLVDATFLKKSDRQIFKNIAETHSLSFSILNIYAPDSVLRSRIIERNKSGNDASEADLFVLDKQSSLVERLSTDEIHHTVEVDTCATWSREKIDELVDILKII
jgi:aminoglycoside phosphotransferase family enzyme/predicted kinase